jgi:hypothetical protein
MSVCSDAKRLWLSLNSTAMCSAATPTKHRDTVVKVQFVTTATAATASVQTSNNMSACVTSKSAHQVNTR